MRHATLIELPRLAREQTAVYNLSVVLGGSLLLAGCAQIKFYLPFTFIPVTGQTFGVLVLGAVLGSRRATLATALYLFEGGCGWPVFALGGGWPYLLGAHGGYLFGFLPAAWLVGRLSELGWDRSYARSIAAMTLGTALILLFGVTWLFVFLNWAGTPTGWSTAVSLGVTPFLLGALVKIGLAAALLPSLWKLPFARPWRRSGLGEPDRP